MLRQQQKITLYKLKRVVWISLVWTLLAALDAMNTFALVESQFFIQVEQFRFYNYLWVNIISAMLAGLISGAVLIFILRDRMRYYTYGLAITFSSVVILSINMFITIIVVELFTKHNTDVDAIFFMTILENMGARFGNVPFYGKSLVFWLLITIVTIVFLNINEKYGQGVFVKMLYGSYHQPNEEERIFMFVDLKSSTTIAEQLGHINFFNLLNDFFRDVTDSIIYTYGEIYQYVGDEVIISWSMEKGTKNANCIRCFYAMQDAIKLKANDYLNKYGVVPEFKAGLHFGKVTTGEIGVIKRDIVYSGDVLNTASRIQSMCNRFGVKILFSKQLLARLKLAPHTYVPKRMGYIDLKGKKQKVELFTLENASNRFINLPIIQYPDDTTK